MFTKSSGVFLSFMQLVSLLCVLAAREGVGVGIQESTFPRELVHMQEIVIPPKALDCPRLKSQKTFQVEIMAVHRS